MIIPLENQNPHFPLDGNPHLFQPFTLGKIPNGHIGVDWDIIPKTPTRAILNGVVVITVEDSKVYGRYLTLAHADGCLSLYAHLSKILVHKGDQVLGGTVIALSGGARGADGSGMSTGWHLHLEIRVPFHWESSKFNIDPIEYINSYMKLQGDYANNR